MSDDTIREGVIDDLCAAVFTAPEVMGVVDDYPPTNPAEPPPRPLVGLGDAELPFAYVVDGPERPNADATMAMYDCSLPIEIGVYYKYDPDNPEKRCKRYGRHLLGQVQTKIMVDPNRGGRASNTIEDDNEVGEAVPEERIGLAVWRGHVDYSRARKDPASREGTY